MGVVVLLTSLSLAMPIANCSGPTPVAFDVLALHGPVHEATDFNLAEIGELANRTGRLGKHAPLGFYFGSFGYTVGVDISALSETTCSEPVHVTVTLMLFDRHIQIGKEIVAESCLFALAADHYRRHAAADDAILSESVKALDVTLQQVLLPELQHDAASVDKDRQRLQDAITVAVDHTLVPVHALRADAGNQVDTPEEVRKLLGPCTSGT